MWYCFGIHYSISLRIWRHLRSSPNQYSHSWGLKKVIFIRSRFFLNSYCLYTFLYSNNYIFRRKVKKNINGQIKVKKRCLWKKKLLKWCNHIEKITKLFPTGTKILFITWTKTTIWHSKSTYTWPWCWGCWRCPRPRGWRPCMCSCRRESAGSLEGPDFCPQPELELQPLALFQLEFPEIQIVEVNEKNDQTWSQSWQ